MNKSITSPNQISNTFIMKCINKYFVFFVDIIDVITYFSPINNKEEIFNKVVSRPIFIFIPACQNTKTHN